MEETFLDQVNSQRNEYTRDVVITRLSEINSRVRFWFDDAINDGRVTFLEFLRREQEAT